MDKAVEIKRQPVAVVIGGGITGLVAAYELLKACPYMQIRIIEKDKRPGGVINSLHQNDALLECGPESFSTLKPELVDLAKDLNIENRIIACNSNSRRSFVSLEHKLHALPDGMMFFAPSNLYSFAFSDLFSLTGKLRISCDMLLPAKSDTADESLASFVSRRLGAEALSKLAEPMIAGIYGGDPELLSADSTVPQLVAMERKYGSIIRGLMQLQDSNRAAGASGPRYDSLASFDDGLSVLVSAILKRLPDNCILNQRSATHIRRGSDRRWVVLCNDNSIFNADYLILAAPAQSCANLLSEVNPVLAERLRHIPRSPAIILNLLYERRQIKHALDGFGFVVPNKEGMLVSACSFSSVKFPGRSRPERVLLRVFTGGAQKALAMLMDDEDLVEQSHLELKQILGIEGLPVCQHVSRHEQAIPQYMVGHKELVDSIQNVLAESYGIALAGNSYTGVGLPDCIRSARTAAEKIALIEQTNLQTMVS